MRRLKVLVAAAMLGAVALWGGGSAQAETVQPDSMAEPCMSGLRGSGVIHHICDYGFSHILYDGRGHVFVVGYYDSAVWHTWETGRGTDTYAPWTSLGGVARSRVSLSTFDSGRALRIQVWGADDSFWCRSYNDPVARGRWTDWYRC